MRKLIILVFMLAIASFATAQTASFRAIPADETMQTIGTDYTLTNTVTSWFKFTAKKDMPTFQDFQCHLDSLAGDHTNIAVSLYGRKFSGDDWTQIGSTVNYLGFSSTHDTTITISSTAPNMYREYKANFVGTGTGTTTIAQQIFKQWEH